MTILIDPKTTLIDDPQEQSLIFKSSQVIPDSYLDSLKAERLDSISTPSGEFHRVASIPVAIADKWAREGFDIMREPITEILKRLRKEELDAFITTNKRV